MSWATIVSVHRDFQGVGVASLEAHLDKTPAIVLGSENSGPLPRPIDQQDPPEVANVSQLQKGVHAVSSAWRCEEPEDLEEDFDGDIVDGTTV